MELQDFALLRFHTRLLFSDTQASVLDHRGKIAEAMAKHLKLGGVSIDSTAAEVQSQDGRDRYRIGIAQTFAMLANFDKPEEAIECAGSFLSMALSELDSPDVSSVNIHTVDVAPAESFDLVRDRLAGGLLSKDVQTLSNTIGVPFSDIGWSTEFKDPNRHVSIRVGPMQSDQLSDLLQEQDADAPPNMLYLEASSDLQIGRRKARDALESWAQAVDEHQSMTERVSDWLKEALSE